MDLGILSRPDCVIPIFLSALCGEFFSDHARSADYGDDARFPHGFCVGLKSTSLINACGLCVTSISTAWATSSATNILSGILPSCGPNSVCVEPGQTTATLILYPRSSSATEYVSPFSPHFVAE